MLANILLGLILLVLVFIALMIFIAGEKYFGSKKR
mgnify:FL=1